MFSIINNSRISNGFGIQLRAVEAIRCLTADVERFSRQGCTHFRTWRPPRLALFSCSSINGNLDSYRERTRMSCSSPSVSHQAWALTAIHTLLQILDLGSPHSSFSTFPLQSSPSFSRFLPFSFYTPPSTRVLFTTFTSLQTSKESLLLSLIGTFHTTTTTTTHRSLQSCSLNLQLLALSHSSSLANWLPELLHTIMVVPVDLSKSVPR